MLPKKTKDEQIADLQKQIAGLQFQARLHAGDCCSLNNEVELFRGHWEDAETQCDLLQKKLVTKNLSWVRRKLGVMFGTRCPACFSKNFKVNFMLRHGCNKCSDCGHMWGNSTHECHDQ